MKFKMYLFAILTASILMSCGDNNEKKDDNAITIGGKKETKKKDANSVTIGLTGNDLMKFDKNEIKVKAGQKVTLNFRHVGKMDKLVMGHNFVLLKQGTDITEFAIKASEAGQDEDWIPEGGANVIVHTEMIGGGQSTSITFDAPEAGTYDFICSFPGHAALMKGKFIVE
ncbi:MAG: azurin [Flavobacteriaceae bacterium]|nr:azurin [Flavobacteriaceae bacterium]|tara:strand:- start:16926 stop:17435 length:510 start_codon:yes stop_codon:yes gene_type:complete